MRVFSERRVMSWRSFSTPLQDGIPLLFDQRCFDVRFDQSGFWFPCGPCHRGLLPDHHPGSGDVSLGLAFRWVSMTGGDNGISGIVRPDIGLPIALKDPLTFYYFIFVFFLIALILMAILIRSLSVTALRAFGRVNPGCGCSVIIFLASQIPVLCRIGSIRRLGRCLSGPISNGFISP